MSLSPRDFTPYLGRKAFLYFSILLRKNGLHFGFNEGLDGFLLAFHLVSYSVVRLLPIQSTVSRVFLLYTPTPLLPLECMYRSLLLIAPPIFRLISQKYSSADGKLHPTPIPTHASIWEAYTQKRESG